MSGSEELRRFAIVGAFNIETARDLAQRARPTRPARPGFKWVLREWTETENNEVTAYAQWLEEPAE